MSIKWELCLRHNCALIVFTVLYVCLFLPPWESHWEISVTFVEYMGDKFVWNCVLCLFITYLLSNYYIFSGFSSYSLIAAILLYFFSNFMYTVLAFWQIGYSGFSFTSDPITQIIISWCFYCQFLYIENGLNEENVHHTFYIS